MNFRMASICVYCKMARMQLKLKRIRLKNSLPQRSDLQLTTRQHAIEMWIIKNAVWSKIYQFESTSREMNANLSCERLFDINWHHRHTARCSNRIRIKKRCKNVYDTSDFAQTFKSIGTTVSSNQSHAHTQIEVSFILAMCLLRSNAKTININMRIP